MYKERGFCPTMVSGSSPLRPTCLDSNWRRADLTQRRSASIETHSDEPIRRRICLLTTARAFYMLLLRSQDFHNSS